MDLGNVRAGMGLVGAGGEPLGAVDHVDGNRVEPRRDDRASGGQHRWLAQGGSASVDGNTVRPAVPDGRARQSSPGEAASPEEG